MLLRTTELLFQIRLRIRPNPGSFVRCHRGGAGFLEGVGKENAASQVGEKTASYSRGPGAQPPDFCCCTELCAKPIGYQYRFANSTNFEKVQDS